MYIFLCNLCVNYLHGAAGFYPIFLHDLILDSYGIPSFMCGLQSCVIYSSAGQWCDNWSMVKLSCESVNINNLMALIVLLFYICLTALIILSYIKRIVACKASLENKRKFR